MLADTPRGLLATSLTLLALEYAIDHMIAAGDATALVAEIEQIREVVRAALAAARARKEPELCAPCAPSE